MQFEDEGWCEFVGKSEVWGVGETERGGAEGGMP
jgi:hypothetical protein